MEQLAVRVMVKLGDGLAFTIQFGFYNNARLFLFVAFEFGDAVLFWSC
jgi:hypothetical protein